MKNDNKVEVNILGSQFFIVADENPDYVNKVIEMYKVKIQETQSNIGLSDPLKVAILTGILIADELFKEQESAKSVHRQNKLLEEDINKVNHFTKVLNKVLEKTIG